MRSSFPGNNLISVKAYNLQVILLSLLYEETLSRSELPKLTHLSNTTITNLLSELLEEGLAAESDWNDEDLTGLRPVGRPRTSRLSGSTPSARDWAKR